MPKVGRLPPSLSQSRQPRFWHRDSGVSYFLRCARSCAMQTVVIDGRAHMLGRLASIVAKQILNGNQIVSFLWGGCVSVGAGHVCTCSGGVLLGGWSGRDRPVQPIGPHGAGPACAAVPAASPGGQRGRSVGPRTLELRSTSKQQELNGTGIQRGRLLAIISHPALSSSWHQSRQQGANALAAGRSPPARGQQQPHQPRHTLPDASVLFLTQVIVRAEEIMISGGIVRQKWKYERFLRKRMNTNPTRGPFHFRAPSRIFWRTVRG